MIYETHVKDSGWNQNFYFLHQLSPYWTQSTFAKNTELSKISQFRRQIMKKRVQSMPRTISRWLIIDMQQQLLWGQEWNHWSENWENFFGLSGTSRTPYWLVPETINGGELKHHLSLLQKLFKSELWFSTGASKKLKNECIVNPIFLIGLAYYIDVDFFT